jgi:hypothetical protein
MPFVSSTGGSLGYGRQQPIQAVTPSGPGVTSGLIIQLDASNSASYPGSGTTWTNLQTAAYGSGTLTNGPTFTAASPTYFTFDGINDYVDIADNVAIRPSIGGSVTAILWAYVTSFTDFEGLLSKQFGMTPGGYDGFSLVLRNNGSTFINRIQLNMNGGAVNGGYTSATNNNFSLNTWTMFSCVVRFGGGAGNPSLAYVNSTQVVSAANAESSIPNNNAPLRLASGIQEGTPYPACRIGAFYYYNRALSAAEITTVFTTTQGRFGV